MYLSYPYVSTPFSPDFAAQWKKKAREREWERERKKEWEEDLYVQWQPVIPVAATGSAPRYISLSRSLPRRVLSTKSGAKLYQILAALTRLARFCLVWYTCETKEGYTNCCIYPSLYAFRSCMFRLCIFAGCSKNRIFSRGKARCTGESRSRAGTGSWYEFLDTLVSTGWVDFYLFFFFSQFVWIVVLLFRFCWK